MSKDGLKRLPDSIVAPLLRALVCIPRRPDHRLTLQRADGPRPPSFDQNNDYNVLWRGRPIGRIWKYEYPNHTWTGLGPWHWGWRSVPDRPDMTGHGPNLEAVMQTFVEFGIGRKAAWLRSLSRSRRRTLEDR
jgi:hypothetical protein